MSSHASLNSRLGLLLTLYICQGLPTGVFSQALPAILRRYDVPLTVIGLTGLLAMPWALKFLWAPWVESHFSARWGQRRSWILPMQVLGAITLVLIAFFDPYQLATSNGVALFFVLMFMVNLFAATQDIATDGLAVRTLDFHERGMGNGVQVAGYRLGLIIGGGLLLYLIGAWDWRGSFLVLAALLVLLTIPVWRLREPAAELSRHREPMPYLRIFTSFFDRPGLKGWLIVLVTYKAGESLGSAMVKPMLVDMGLDLKQIGLMVSIVGSIAALTGALLGGWLTAVIGRYYAIIGFGALQGLGVAAYGWLSWQHDANGTVSMTAIYSINALEHFVSGMAMAALLTAVMDLSRPEHAGADFTVQVSILAIFGGSFYLGAGFVAEALGYTGYYLVSGALALVLLWPAAVYCRRLPWLVDGRVSGDNSTP
ncbi:MAG: MFS transporter [Moraxellaceae bacterium]|jgi:PAT family beta-lactamase induction signal transducer AmpG|nr:MFS transporter [Moraxellaceae bacterium]